MATYGFGGGMQNPTRTPQQQTNFQQQTPYAGQNNMFASPTQNSTAPTQETQTTQTATGTSPVTPDGNINPNSQIPGTMTQVSGQGMPNENAWSQFTPYVPVNQGGNDVQQQALIGSILQNPHSMTELGVAQMKGASQDQLLSNYQQQSDLRASDQAGRGTYGGGTAQAQDLMAQTALNEALMNSNRGIDIKQMETDRADELKASEAATAQMNALQNRSADSYATGMTPWLQMQGLETGKDQAYMQNLMQLLGILGNTDLGYGSQGVNWGQINASLVR